MNITEAIKIEMSFSLQDTVADLSVFKSIPERFPEISNVSDNRFQGAVFLINVKIFLSGSHAVWQVCDSYHTFRVFFNQCFSLILVFNSSVHLKKYISADI